MHAHLDSARWLPGRSGGSRRAGGRGRPRGAAGGLLAGRWEEGGFDDDVSVTFALSAPDGTVAAAANLTDFGGMTADVGVFTHPANRGRGLGRLVAAAAIRHAPDHHAVARWCAKETNAPSLVIAEALGFEPWCRQLAVRPEG